MLISLSIRQFTLVDHLDIDFQSGMTAITGETGAGKSLILDALGLALGDRGDTDRIRLGADKAEVCASFALDRNPEALRWLSEHDFEYEGDECLLRRILSGDGRSRGYINGQQATMTQLRDLGAFFIDIHSQHEHQSLLVKDQQRTLLDNFGGHQGLVDTVATGYRNWASTRHKLDEWQKQISDSKSQQELLAFQLDELNQVALLENEVETLEEQQLLLANAEGILAASQQVLALCDGDDRGDHGSGSEAIHAALNKACALLEAVPQLSKPLHEALALLDSARIQVTEAMREIQHHIDSSDLDPIGLQQIEERLSLAYQLARKHKVAPIDLPALQLRLSEQLARLAGAETDLAALGTQVKEFETAYLATANKLSKARAKAAAAFASAVNKQLADLAMAGATIDVSITPHDQQRYSLAGLESVEILVSTNPGQPHRPLNKVASGGELSRISLAIQVVAAEHANIPVLVFDEVDVGVGGATASVIGRLLRKLGNKGQVICISHQPQVASCAQHHLVATKQRTRDKTESILIELDQAARTEEIARMLGGEQITPKTRSHAEEMLSSGAIPTN